MADVYDKSKRSEIMSHIKGANTRPEVSLRKALFAKGLRYRINEKRLIGKPDIVFPKYRTVIFVHGCYWHGHEGCKFAYVPKSNTSFWIQKIQQNKQRDYLVLEQLKTEGWQVLVVWECEIKTKMGLLQKSNEIEVLIRKQG